MPTNLKEINFVDLVTMAQTIFGEARGESREGKIAVAHVILNRYKQCKKRKQFGDGTIESVCLAPFQFSCWNKNDINYAIINEVDFVENKTFLECVMVSFNVLTGKIKDNTNGSNHYYSCSMKTPPDWSASITEKKYIGNHVFMKA